MNTRHVKLALFVGFILGVVFAFVPLRGQNQILGNAIIQNTVRFTGDITPTQLTADVNDYAPASFSSNIVLRMSSDATRTVTGLAGGTEGRWIWIWNVGAQAIVLKNESVLSVAANRFALANDYNLAAGASVQIIYDATSSRWRAGGSADSGTVSSVSVTTANGVSGTVATATSTPAISLTLGAITPSSVSATGNVSAGGDITVTGNDLVFGGTSSLRDNGSGAVTLASASGQSANLTATGASAVNLASGVSTSANVFTFLAPSLGTSNFVGHVFGVNTSTGNSVQQTFTYAGSGSASNLWSIGMQNAAGAITFDGNRKVTIPVTTASTSTTTGGLIVSGGMGVAGDTYQGGSFNLYNGVNPYVRIDTTTLAGNAGVWFRQSSPTSNNYGIVGNATSTYMNAATGGTVGFRIGNGDVLTYTAAAGLVTPANLTFGTSGSVLSGTTGSIGLAATGTNQDVSLTPSGTGNVVVATNANVPSVAALRINNTSSAPVWQAFTSTGTVLSSFSRSTNATVWAGGNTGSSVTVDYGPNANVTLTSAGTGGLLTYGQQLSASYKFTVSAYDTAAMAANVGSGIGFGGNYTSGALKAIWSGMAGLKETATDGEFGGYLAFYSRLAAGSMNEVGRFTSTGKLLLGTTTDSSNGKLQLATHTTSAGGIGFGTDTVLFRSGTSVVNLNDTTGSYGIAFNVASAANRLSTVGGGSSLALRVNAAGSDQFTLTGSALTLGTATPLSVTSTTASTSTTTGALIVSGGAGVAGGLNVGGNAGIGANLSSAIGLTVAPTALSSVTQYGMSVRPTATSAATNTVAGGLFGYSTAASAFTAGAGYTLWVQSPTIGATSAVTSGYGIVVSNQGAAGITNAYGIDIAAQSGAATTNIGLRNAGTTSLTNSTDRTYATDATGAFIVAGGASITKGLQVGLSSADTYPFSAGGNGGTNFVALGGGATAKVQGFTNALAATTLALQPSGGALSVGSSATVATFNGTTASSSTTTGSLINSGGFGNAGAGYFGGNLTISSNLSSAASTDLTLSPGAGGNNRVLIAPTGTGAVQIGTDASATNTILFRSSSAFIDTINTPVYLKRQSGAGNAALEFFNSSNAAVIRLQASATGLDFYNTGGSTHWMSVTGTGVGISPTTASTSTTTGALIVSGGAGIAGALNVGGNVTRTSASTSAVLNVTAENTSVDAGSATNGGVEFRLQGTGSGFLGALTAYGDDYTADATLTGKVVLSTSSNLANGLQLRVAGVNALQVNNSSAVLAQSATGGLGYGTGAGGAVTQITSRTTGVTLNKVSGAITLVSAAGSTSWQSFTVTNSAVAATDTVIVNQKSGTDLYMIHVTAVGAGSFRISYATTGGTTTEQPVFNFAVIKAVAS